MTKLKIKIEKKKSPLDINDLFPGYFKKSVFRGVVVVMLLFTLFVYTSNDNQLKFNWVTCPEESEAPCDYWNPDNYTQTKPDLIAPGVVIGNKPNFFGEYYNSLSLLIVFVGFFINHALYFLRTNKLGVPVNKVKWQELKDGFNTEKGPTKKGR